MGVNISTPLNRSANESAIKQASDDSTFANSCPRGNARISQNVLLIWLDQTIDQENNTDSQKIITQLRRISSSVDTFTDPDQCVTFLSKIKDEKACIIISGSLGRKTVSRVHDMSQVNSIFIFCGNIAWHEE